MNLHRKIRLVVRKTKMLASGAYRGVWALDENHVVKVNIRIHCVRSYDYRLVPVGKSDPDLSNEKELLFMAKLPKEKQHLVNPIVKALNVKGLGLVLIFKRVNTDYSAIDKAFKSSPERAREVSQVIWDTHCGNFGLNEKGELVVIDCGENFRH